MGCQGENTGHGYTPIDPPGLSARYRVKVTVQAWYKTVTE